jgi:hypothetical protein
VEVELADQPVVLAEQPVPAAGEAVDVGLQPEPQAATGDRDLARAGLGQEARQRLHLLVEQPVDRGRHHATQQDGPVLAAVHRQAGVRHGHAPGRLVASGVTDLELGQGQHVSAPPAR